MVSAGWGRASVVSPHLDAFLITRESAVYPLALLEAMTRGVPIVAMGARGIDVAAADWEAR